jgi:multisubunit Na+/H+ antiporter MnhF subunit
MTHAWMIAAIAFLVPLTLSFAVLVRGPVPHRLAAVQIASTLTVLELAALSFAFDQPATLDMALCLALLSLPGTLLYALFEERWL